jgi:hypothetical protein
MDCQQHTNNAISKLRVHMYTKNHDVQAQLKEAAGLHSVPEDTKKEEKSKRHMRGTI